MKNSKKKLSYRDLPKFEDLLQEHLKENDAGTYYLTEALKEDDFRFFFLALKDVIRAKGGMTWLARELKCSRTSLYKSLSSESTVGFLRLKEILGVLGLEFEIHPRESFKKAA